MLQIARQELSLVERSRFKFVHVIEAREKDDAGQWVHTRKVRFSRVGLWVHPNTFIVCVLLPGELLAFWVVTRTGIRPVKWPQQSFWNLMFSVMSGCQQGSWEGVPCDHYPWCIGHHCTGPLLDLGSHCTGKPRPSSQTWDPTVQPPPILKSGGQEWRPFHPLYRALPVLASFGYWSTYCWQLRGMHPTGMPSCLTPFT